MNDLASSARPSDTRPPEPARAGERARTPLIPREHGAYGQLGMSLVAALAIGGLGVAPVALALAAILAFVAHESLLVLLGQRGRRVKDEEGPRARTLLAILGGLAAASGLVGLWLAPNEARLGLLPPIVLLAVVAWLVVNKLEKTAAGEMAVGAALASSGLAVALAGGAPRAAAMASCFVWTMGFAMATMSVQAVLLRARSKGREDRGERKAIAIGGLLAFAFGVSLLAGFPLAAPAALVPTAALSIAICVRRPSPRKLREMGWAMVASSAFTLVVLVMSLR
ncbi:MAG TPA: YwiC-like family protein [Anaeromyxobacteraceae bacterium]|nr:YwiC-like family protein [Anaeromyxobacteraceae bacterium]